QYAPSPATGAQVRKEGDRWTLILVRQLRHPPEKVWEALTDPAQLREWAPFTADSSLGEEGAVSLTWTGNPTAVRTRVTRAEPDTLLECGDMRWELEASEGGTRLTLWHKIDRRFVAWGAAGWHVAFDVLGRLLGGNPVDRAAASAGMKSAWQRLIVEYARQFGLETPAAPPAAGR
ncbi:MAG TPA: SRPBCC domain-containing protein, partial [Terriglobales bacterium]|nr:SRPBCC domain-containing protein [Terriglobales bacterium]